ncbi:MAG: hypothetical protein ABEJ74_01550 [Haloferacaceae archaeon]
MNARRVLGIALLVVVVLVAAVAGGLFLYSQQLYRDSYGSDYTYDVHVSPSAPISNVTILVPLPAQGSDSPVNASSVQHPFTPDGWTYDVVETDAGPMLRVRADEVPTDPTYHASVVRDDRLVGWKPIPADEYDPDNGSHVRATHDDVEVHVTLESDRTVDTRSAIEDEPLLRPQRNRTETACFGGQDDEEACYDYGGRAFVSYDAAPDTAVYVSVELRGTNSWWVFGWNFNEYTDRQTVEVVGPQDGWVATEGDLHVGSGNYPRPPR